MLSAYSCSDELEGDWDDNIKLSQKAVEFSAEPNSIIITTEGESWWIGGISINRTSNFDLSGIDIISKNFVIEEVEFRIERKDATEIHIEISENLTGAERVFYFDLQAGNYFDGIQITQSAN